MSLTQVIKDQARHLGFMLSGITSPEPPSHWPAFERWLSLGRQGSMGYLQDPRRADPRLVLQGCRSILVLAMRYPDPFRDTSLPASTSQAKMEPRGSIAAYARGLDYHQVIGERLRLLAQFIETQAGSPLDLRMYTDTGPLLERDLAQRAGLGWIGKNTCLIHPGIGSYFFLAEILMDLELEVDPPFSMERCGTCTRCITACPTRCIQGDRTLDARGCISYLTIENKREIPPEFRGLIGNRIFGCDVCQQVCPWNRFSKDESDPAFVALPDLWNPILAAELGLTSQEFTLRFQHSPVLRSKRRGYLRNVAVALGNSGDLTVLPVLDRALQDEDPLIQEHAAWALKQIQTRHSITV